MILHIVIHSQDQLSLSIIHSGHNGIVLSKILSQVDSFYIWIFFCKSMYGFPGMVSGIIIYQNKFTLVIF